MPKLVLTYKDKQFIRRNRLKMRIMDIAAHIGVARDTIRRYMVHAGVALTKKERYQLQSERAKGRTTSTPAIDRILKKSYLLYPVKQLAKKVGKSHTFVICRLRQLDLKIPRKIIDQRIQESRIQPGNIPANKGKKMSRKVYKKCQATMFKKGQLPHTTLYDGCIRVRIVKKAGNRPYKWIRISKANWKMLHVHTWEQKHGPVPKGYIVIFRNKDTMDCRLKNLKMITLAENMRRNTIHNLPPDLKKTVINIRTLNRKIKKYEQQTL